MERAANARPDRIDALRRVVIDSMNAPEFQDRELYVKYHLEIMECISEELLLSYPHAERDVVLAMVWVHDYGKVFSREEARAATLVAGRTKLTELGFEG